MTDQNLAPLEADATVGATPVENQAQANLECVEVTLTDGRVIGNDKAVRWYSVRSGKYIYEVEVDGKLYLGRQLEDGRIDLV
jgi:hypothetical protein